MFKNTRFTNLPEGESASVWTVSYHRVFESFHWLASLGVVHDQSGISFMHLWTRKN